MASVFEYTGPWPPYNFVNILPKLWWSSAMLIVDSLVISGVRFVLTRLIEAVETEMDDAADLDHREVP